MDKKAPFEIIPRHEAKKELFKVEITLYEGSGNNLFYTVTPPTTHPVEVAKVISIVLRDAIEKVRQELLAIKKPAIEIVSMDDVSKLRRPN